MAGCRESADRWLARPEVASIAGRMAIGKAFATFGQESLNERRASRLIQSGWPPGLATNRFPLLPHLITQRLITWA